MTLRDKTMTSMTNHGQNASELLKPNDQIYCSVSVSCCNNNDQQLSGIAYTYGLKRSSRPKYNNAGTTARMAVLAVFSSVRPGRF